jgi:hypothetical protein
MQATISSPWMTTTLGCRSSGRLVTELGRSPSLGLNRASVPKSRTAAPGYPFTIARVDHTAMVQGSDWYLIQYLRDKNVKGTLDG